MKKLFLIAIGVTAAVAFIGFDSVSAFMDQTRDSIREKLSSPEMDLECKLNEAKSLADRCADSVIKGRVHLARLDALVQERDRQLVARTARLDRDRQVLERRQALLQNPSAEYRIGNEIVSHRTLNRDALLRARGFKTDRAVLQHLEDTVVDLRAQSTQTAAEIELAEVEQVRLREEIVSLRAELENLKARRAVAQTRQEAGYIFDRSTFDNAREKVAELRATIAEQNKRLDFYGRSAAAGRGLIPADLDVEEEDGLALIETVLRQ